mmetsp:Transcript_66039/g.182868  ORF Transcript_66039/g.182868 Transcript_66039/m.182868 type:complete len:344 (-) Transcript_66039:279-1310(-)
MHVQGVDARAVLLHLLKAPAVPVCRDEVTARRQGLSSGRHHGHLVLVLGPARQPLPVYHPILPCNVEADAVLCADEGTVDSTHLARDSEGHRRAVHLCRQGAAFDQPSVALGRGLRADDLRESRRFGFLRMEALLGVPVQPDLELFPPVLAHDQVIDVNASTLHFHGFRFPLREGACNVEALPGLRAAFQGSAPARPEDQPLALRAPRRGPQPLILHVAPSEAASVGAGKTTGQRPVVRTPQPELHQFAQAEQGFLPSVHVGVHLPEVAVGRQQAPSIRAQGPDQGTGAGMLHVPRVGLDACETQRLDAVLCCAQDAGPGADFNSVVHETTCAVALGAVHVKA